MEYLRGSKFATPADAEYQLVLAAQNEGHSCRHCDSHSGHFGHCPLINRESAEAASFVAGNYSDLDYKYAKVFGIVL